jgi:hypothetical protein
MRLALDPNHAHDMLSNGNLFAHRGHALGSIRLLWTTWSLPSYVDPSIVHYQNYVRMRAVELLGSSGK